MSEAPSAAASGGAASAGAPPWLDRSGLPEAVRRFARLLPLDAPPIRTAHLEQRGTFRMGDGERSWRPFTASETFTADPVGFVWTARIRVLPGVAVQVRDTYAGGSGSMKAALLGLVPVMDLSDSRALSEGALLRYLAEAVWIPTRLLQGGGLTWSPGGDSSTAIASLADGPLAVSLRFTFDADGDVIRIEGMRPREVDGAFVATPWIGRFEAHRELGGYRIPTRGEVAWEIDGEVRPYWRGTVESVRFTV